MNITIRINCDNAAFEDENCGDEVARILERLAGAFQGAHADNMDDYDRKPLIDINGNTVGTVKVTR